MTIHSFVGSNTTIKGNLECSDDFLVEGAVEGNLHSDGTIVVGRDAEVRGEVTARELALSGALVGTIRCSDRVEVFESAKIAGTVQTPVLMIKPGAQVHARIIMSPTLKEPELISHSPEDTYSSVAKARP